MAKGATATTVPRVFILLIDDLSYSPLRGKAMFAAAGRFAASLPAADLVGVATTTGTTVVNPTADRAAVTTALSKIVGAYIDPRITAGGGPASPRGDSQSAPDQPTGIAQALEIERGNGSALKEAIGLECYNGVFPAAQSLEQVLADSQCAQAVQSGARMTASQLKSIREGQARSYEAIVRAMASATGIKHLVLLTDGVALGQDVESMTPLARAAAASGVELTVLMENLDASMTDEGRRTVDSAVHPIRQTDTGAPQRRREDNQLFLNGARTVADLAGGTFYQIAGTPDPFFERIATATSGIYRLAIEAPPNTPPGKDFTLSARVLKHPGVTARANRRAVLAAPAAATAVIPSAPAPARPAAVVSPDEQMKRAIATGRAMSGIEIAMSRAIRRADDPGQVAIMLTIDISPKAQAPLKTTFGLVDAAGSIRVSDRTLEAPDDGGGYRLAFNVPVAPGAYKLRFAAADATGAVGAVETAVDARLARMGPLLASDVLRWTIDAAGTERPLTGPDLPADATRLLAAIELSPGLGDALPPDVLVKFALLGAGPEPLVERVVVPESAEGVLRAEAEFGLDKLSPGAYTVRATVIAGPDELGRATAAVTRR